MSNRKRWWTIGTVSALVIALAVTACFLWPGFLVTRSRGGLVATGKPLRLTPAPLPLVHVVTTGELMQAREVNYDENFKTSFQAEAAYVVDESGTVLYAENEHERLYPASTTKMMTAYLAVQHTEDLFAPITVGKLEGCYEDGSILLYLEEGDQLTMFDLLLALLLYSYNDAATAIAMEVGGSLEGFAQMMNDQAEALGAKNTHFVTPHGLHNDAHYTSAYDLNLILQAVYAEETLREIMLQPEVTIEVVRENEPFYRDIENASFFVREAYEVPGMDYVAGKTGYTSKAGSCLASAFALEDDLYFSTIMKSEDASYMTAVLLDYYFAPEALASFSKKVPLMRELISG